MTNFDPQRFRIVVRGRVQNVGYRLFTHGAGIALGVTGTVRNLPDGSVETIAQADPATLGRFLAALRVGPPTGSVDGLSLEPLDPDPSLSGFDIIR
ncbi:MAG TPA: acylphosphatase [Tepidiformaceae bacterium]|nr:acylphosphatase [Tepidiformaceae bacterium]